jgi:hypothetical protein
MSSQLRERLDVLGPAPRTELLHVLMLPDFDRADRIGEFWGYPQSRAFAELLIDCEEDQTLRAVLVGMLREAERKPRNRRQFRAIERTGRLVRRPSRQNIQGCARRESFKNERRCP